VPDGVPAVRLTSITKRFPGVVANHDINLSIAKGEVHALCGENGAGKSTLMKILYGMQRPDEGTIEIDGEQVILRSPADAIARGIGMVHQHFKLADNLTVLENIVLGAERLHGIGSRARARIIDIAGQYGLSADPDALVEKLGVGDRQRVEIIKVLYRGARILILDEPTAVLVPQEVNELFANLHELTSEGLTVVFISHKLDEVRKVADSITVIRRGETVGTVDSRAVTSRQLAELMVGSVLPTPELRDSTVTDRVVLDIAGLTLLAPDARLVPVPDREVADAGVDEVGSTAVGRTVLGEVSLTIHAGEILGIAGVEGNGQSELVEAIMGLRRADAGRISFAGADITGWSTRRRREAGIAYIPEDRHRHGLMLEGTLWENRMLGHQTQRPNARGPWIDRRGAKRDTMRIVKEYDVRTPGINVPAAALSGGNQQKLIVGREMSGEPKLLIAAHPTRGIDVGAQAAIWEYLRQARAAGLAVLLISADLEELIGMSDTLHVVLRGRLVAQVDPSGVTPEELGSAMTGAEAAS
jgi:simple sugar transport system ATP-binding protein